MDKRDYKGEAIYTYEDVAERLKKCREDLDRLASENPLICNRCSKVLHERITDSILWVGEAKNSIA